MRRKNPCWFSDGVRSKCRSSAQLPFPFIHVDGYLWLRWSEVERERGKNPHEKKKKTSTNKNFPFFHHPSHPHGEKTWTQLRPNINLLPRREWKLCWVDFLCRERSLSLIFSLNSTSQRLSGWNLFIEFSSSRFFSSNSARLGRSWKEFCWWNLLWSTRAREKAKKPF